MSRSAMSAGSIPLTHYWMGGRSMIIRQKVISGPATLIGREIALQLDFDTIKQIYQTMLECELRVETQERALKAINARNRGDDDESTVRQVSEDQKD